MSTIRGMGTKWTIILLAACNAERLELPDEHFDPASGYTFTEEGPTVSVINLDVMETYSDEDTRAVASISLMPRDAGLITIPSFEFQSDTSSYRTSDKTEYYPTILTKI